jgi:hypothetical protein
MNLTYIEATLQNLQPLEILEALKLDQDSSVLVESLADYIEENQDDIKEQLIEDGIISEGDDD